MKKTILKWVLQIFLASVLVFLTGKYLPGGGADEGLILLRFLLATALASTLGVTLGDPSLYTGHKFSLSAVAFRILAIVSALVLGGVGYILALFAGDLVQASYGISKTALVAGAATYFGLATIPPLIGHNTVTLLSRKYWYGGRRKKKQ